MLDKLATTGGGPEYHIGAGRALYTTLALDEYAQAKIGPAQRSTENSRPTPPPRTGSRPRGRPFKHPAITSIGESSV